MKMHIQVLWRDTKVLERLQGDGWELEATQEDSLCARHHQVANQAEARRRLHRLGLLTSPAVRVAFSETGPHPHRV